MFRLVGRVLVVVAFLVALFVAVPFVIWLRDAIGTIGVSFVWLAFLAMAAWLGHTPDSAAAAEDFRAALRDAGLSQKHAAIEMGVSEPTLTNQLSGKEAPTRLWQGLTVLGPVFRVAFYKRQLAREQHAVIERGDLCDLVNAVQVLTAERRRSRPLHMEVA